MQAEDLTDLLKCPLADGLGGQHKSGISRVYPSILHMLCDSMDQNLESGTQWLSDTASVCMRLISLISVRKRSSRPDDLVLFLMGIFQPWSQMAQCRCRHQHTVSRLNNCEQCVGSVLHDAMRETMYADMRCQKDNFQHFTHRKGDLYHQATVCACRLMSCRVISSFKLLLTTAFIRLFR